MIKVTIVTGFLGAGKSTLIQTWLEQLPREETAVIVNERGDIGIDGELLAGRAARLREITGGCVCCNSQAELVQALIDFADAQPGPSRIVIETSGAASPAGVIRALNAERMRERFQLDGVVTVVDAVHAREALAFDVAIEQLAFSDIVVLTHVDAALASPELLDGVQALVLEHAPAAVIARAQRGQLELSFCELLAKRVEALQLPPERSTHTAIEAVSLMYEGELDEARFGEWVETALGSVEARILRIKGILAIKGLAQRVIVQGVSQAVEVELGAAWPSDTTVQRSSRLVVLGLGLDAAALETGFLACAAAS